jgi:SAM-dependent methyltransferase
VGQEPIRFERYCRVCGGTAGESVLELTPTPPEDEFVPQERLGNVQDVYPLELVLCAGCGYVYLPHVLSPQVSYQDYIYETKTTIGLSGHYQEYADKLVKDLRIQSDALIVDIGSNDGTMLEAFARHRVRGVGVEPNSAIASAANDRGRQTLCGYFTFETAVSIAKDFGKAAAITANYVYANIDDLSEFTRGVAELLAPDGVFVIQTGYHPDQMKCMMFDYIYHEHFSYFTVKSLVHLLGRCGLELINVERSPQKGGSIRAYVQHEGGSRPVSESVAALMEEERCAGIHERSVYDRFADQIVRAKEDLFDVLSRIQEKGTRIVGYGASHSTTTLVYHFGLGDLLDYLVDDNPLKQGLFSPGLHLPVYAPRKLHEDGQACALILAWQHAESILARNKETFGGGRQIIVPLPKLRLIEGL